MKNTQPAKTGAVLIVGGGVAGVQAALDLSGLGYLVYVAEKSSSIGGVMARLDKTFPTNDCSLCILAPKLVEVARSPNIRVLTNAELMSIKGEKGDFIAQVRVRPRYINEDLCTACGACTMYCPRPIDDGYNEALSLTHAAHMEYPQAVPTAYYVDPASCLFLKHGMCKICVSTCQAQAIDFSQQEEIRELAVGAVILAPGFGRLDSAELERFGYGIFPDVLTSFEFERMMCASGPSTGEIIVPSHGRHPKRIAFVQCVGSRDLRPENGYCSSVCCMYAIKEATVVKEHDPNLDITIFHMDMRTQGKNFDASRKRAQEEYGLRFVRARIAGVQQDTHGLRLAYASEEGVHRGETFDLVILSVGLESPEDAEDLAQAAGIDLNHYNFCSTDPFSPLETSRPGIFVAGAFQGPKDIPESVTQACGSAAMVSEVLADARNTNVSKKEYPPPVPIDSDIPRIGVFVCHCGINIGGVVDVPKVKEYAETLDNVVYAANNPYSCSQDTQEIIKNAIEEHRLNRVVVAACTPRTHEPLFRETLKDAGLNPSLFEMANIRDQCSWVHMHEPGAATEKAKDLVRMAVAKAALLAPLEAQSVSVTPKALVIGGGIAGMTAALSVAEQGFECFLVEKSDRLGGNLGNVRFTLSGQNPMELVRTVEEKIHNNPLITVYTNAETTAISGYIGNFTTTITNNGTDTTIIEHGVIIVATGGTPYQPNDYCYNESERVVTQLELERLLENNPAAEKLNEVVMIQCVGSRGEDLAYCSKLCCGQAIKNALKIKERNPISTVYVLYRDIRAYGFTEDAYREARKQGVVFIPYKKENPPQVINRGDRVRVAFHDVLLRETIAVDPDLVVLSVGVVPSDISALSKEIKCPVDHNGFFLEAHVKLQPVEFAVDGVYLCGLAHSPKPIDESIAQAKGAAAKATIPLAKGSVAVKPIVSKVNTEQCIGCGICEGLCPYSAIRLQKTGKRKKARTIAASCHGCGICASHCPALAISMGGFTDQAIGAQIKAFFGEKR